MNPSLDCAVAGQCGGCAWILKPYEQQLEEKRQGLAQRWLQAGLPQEALDSMELHSVGQGGLRDRTDLSMRRGPEGDVLGLWDKDRGQLVDVGACPQLSEPLRAWAVALRQDLPPISRASLRLRCSPQGERGLWVDASNEDIKALLDEGAWLRRQMAQAVVEMGQRRKVVVELEGSLKLRKPELRPWLTTWIQPEARGVPLYGPVGGFTQPGVESNRALVHRITALVAAIAAPRWLELGCGQGNFTLPLASMSDGVVGVEVDPLARQGLLRSAQEAGLEEKITLARANMHRADQAARDLLGESDAVLVDPPRSGLGAFVEVLLEADPASAPRDLIYVSCFADSLVEDLGRLCAAGGWRPLSLWGLDQFPQSPHAEWVVHLRRQA